MEFLKAFFEDGKALTYEELLAKVQEKKMNIVNIADGSYISRNKYDDKVNGLTQQVTDLQGQVAQRDTDLASLNDKLTAAQADTNKLADVQGTLTDLQTQYATEKQQWEAKNAQQAYEFMVRERANGLKFSSGAAKKEFIREAIKMGFKVDGDNLLGYTDFVTKYQADDPGAFVVDTPKNDPDPAPTPSPTIVLPKGGISAPKGKKVSLLDMMKAKNENPSTEIRFE